MASELSWVEAEPRKDVNGSVSRRCAQRRDIPTPPWINRGPQNGPRARAMSRSLADKTERCCQTGALVVSARKPDHAAGAFSCYRNFLVAPFADNALVPGLHIGLRENLVEEIPHGGPRASIGLLVINSRRWAVLRHQPVGESVKRLP